MSSDIGGAKKGQGPRVDMKTAFWVAVAVTIVANLVQPWGRYLLYPFAMLSTWAHEMGHGLTAAILGGEFMHLELYEGLGGVAWHRSPEWAHPFVSMGGLLGPAIAGAFFIVLAAREKTAKWAIAALTVGLAVSLVIWIRPVSSFGFWTIAAITVCMGAVAWKGSPTVRAGVAMFTGIQFCFGSIQDFDYMFTHSFMRGGAERLSDTGRIEEAWFLPYWFWGALIAALSVVIVLLAARWAFGERRARKKKTKPAT